MNRRAAGWILGIALILVLGGAAWWWWQQQQAAGRHGRRGHGEAAGAGAPLETQAFDLYFPSSGGGLRAERRELKVTDAPKDRIRKVVEALLAGPAGHAGPPAAATASGLVRPLPPEVKLGDVQLGADGTAFVDLRWPEHEDPPESGSTEEIQRIYSLVNTVAFNVPQATRIVLLWNGTQRLTFSGHIDTSRPLLPDRTLLTP